MTELNGRLPQLNHRAPDAGRYCALCGRTIGEDAAEIERFGERFCSEPHAEEFVAGVRSARMQGAAESETPAAGACALRPTGQRTWKDYLTRGLCWGAPILLLIAIPLFWSGGLAAAGGSLLSVVALLACPLGMYFMMRAMSNMDQAKQRETHGKTAKANRN